MARGAEPAWAAASDEQLLALAMRDLRLDVARSPMAPLIERLYRELAARGLDFRPHVWFSSSWFAPEGVPGFALPFYLGHPRLARLERALTGEAEGASQAAGMRLLRHECGHALDTAFGLHRRARWRRVFGRYSLPYRRYYRARPGHPDFVTHLPRWYAQGHPAEDWAETFAVWLAGSRPRGLGDGARAKLEAVSEMMEGLVGRPQVVRCRERTESLATLNNTLHVHYRRKLRRAMGEVSAPLDRALGRVFEPGGRPGVQRFLGERRPGGPADPYSIEQALQLCTSHARRRGLGLPRRPRSARAVRDLVGRTLELVRSGRTLLYR
jgi:hypothetical protein